LIKPVILENNQQKIVGILHIPDQLKRADKAPGILMLHGFTGNKTEAHRLFVRVARKLCDAGFIVLRFDFRGSGDSDGEFEDTTVPAQVDDAKKALDYLTSLNQVNQDKVGVIGLSMGGRVAVILSLNDKRVKFLILYSPALGPLKNKFLSQLKREDIKAIELW